MFYIVQLDSDIFKEKIVVPSIWLDKYNTLCLLPPVTDIAEVETLAKSQSVPKHGWQMQSVSFIQSFDTYSQAKENIKKGKPVMIELEEQPRKEGRGKRKRKLPLFLEQYSIEFRGSRVQEECSVRDKIVSDPLIVKTETTEDSNATEYHQQPRLNSTHNESSSSSFQHDSRLQAAASSSSTNIRLNSGITPALSSESVIDIKCSNCSDLEKRITTLEQELVSIKRIWMDTNKTTKDILISFNKIEQQHFPQMFRDFQQLKTTEELAAFNEMLKENEFFAKMVIFFSAFGGKDAPSATRKIMSVLMSNALARKSNWIGGRTKQKIKQSIQEYKEVIQLIAASVRHNKMYEDASIDEIESWIASWLHYAQERFRRYQRKNRWT